MTIHQFLKCPDLLKLQTSDFPLYQSIKHDEQEKEGEITAAVTWHCSCDTAAVSLSALCHSVRQGARALREEGQITGAVTLELCHCSCVTVRQGARALRENLFLPSKLRAACLIGYLSFSMYRTIQNETFTHSISRGLRKQIYRRSHEVTQAGIQQKIITVKSFKGFSPL